MTARRTAIFGGSFNPIHKGHIAVARQVIHERLADEVWMLVSPQNPLKPADGLLDENLRLKLARKALTDEPHILASDFEFCMPRPSYTWNTLQALSRTFPERDFSLLIGADNWQNFSQWAHPVEILSHYPILVYPRTGYAVSPAQLPATVSLIHAPLFPYSSTDVRRVARTGGNLTGMIPRIIETDVREFYK